MSSLPACWCGNCALQEFSDLYRLCPACRTLVPVKLPQAAGVRDDQNDFYGRGYWFDHQTNDLNNPDILIRARADLPQRCVWWLASLLKYRLPPGKMLEIGAGHGGFVALCRWSGFDAFGIEMSPAIVRLAEQLFDVPMRAGSLEAQAIEPASLEVIVMMDVLEHLSDPLGTLRLCKQLLKPDGLLVVQTPLLPAEGDLDQMRQRGEAFIQHLHPEHLYLFSENSLQAAMSQAGLIHQAAEPAIFADYDQFRFASPAPLTVNSEHSIAQALQRHSAGRMALALLDTLPQTQKLHMRLQECEDDRAARLRVIHELQAQLDRGR